MKKIILTIVLICGALGADSVVHYDTSDTTNPISKPNHPSSELYK